MLLCTHYTVSLCVGAHEPNRSFEIVSCVPCVLVRSSAGTARAGVARVYSPELPRETVVDRSRNKSALRQGGGKVALRLRLVATNETATVNQNERGARGPLVRERRGVEVKQ